MACTSKRNGLVQGIESLLQMAPGSGTNFVHVDNFHLILPKLLSYLINQSLESCKLFALNIQMSTNTRIDI